MKKSISKRFKVTRTGKVLRRAMAQSHFLAKKSSTQLRRKKQRRSLDAFGKKIVKKYL